MNSKNSKLLLLVFALNTYLVSTYFARDSPPSGGAVIHRGVEWLKLRASSLFSSPFHTTSGLLEQSLKTTVCASSKMNTPCRLSADIYKLAYSYSVHKNSTLVLFTFFSVGTWEYRSCIMHLLLPRKSPIFFPSQSLLTSFVGLEPSSHPLPGSCPVGEFCFSGWSFGFLKAKPVSSAWILQ